MPLQVTLGCQFFGGGVDAQGNPTVQAESEAAQNAKLADSWIRIHARGAAWSGDWAGPTFLQGGIDYEGPPIRGTQIVLPDNLRDAGHNGIPGTGRIWLRVEVVVAPLHYSHSHMTPDGYARAKADEPGASTSFFQSAYKEGEQTQVNVQFSVPRFPITTTRPAFPAPLPRHAVTIDGVSVGPGKTVRISRLPAIDRPGEVLPGPWDFVTDADGTVAISYGPEFGVLPSPVKAEVLNREQWAPVAGSVKWRDHPEFWTQYPHAASGQNNPINQGWDGMFELQRVMPPSKNPFTQTFQPPDFEYIRSLHDVQWVGGELELPHGVYGGPPVGPPATVDLWILPASTRTWPQTMEGLPVAPLLHTRRNADGSWSDPITLANLPAGQYVLAQRWKVDGGAWLMPLPVEGLTISSGVGWVPPEPTVQWTFKQAIAAALAAPLVDDWSPLPGHEATLQYLRSWYVGEEGDYPRADVAVRSYPATPGVADGTNFLLRNTLAELADLLADPVQEWYVNVSSKNAPGVWPSNFNTASEATFLAWGGGPNNEFEQFRLYNSITVTHYGPIDMDAQDDLWAIDRSTIPSVYPWGFLAAFAGAAPAGGGSTTLPPARQLHKVGFSWAQIQGLQAALAGEAITVKDLRRKHGFSKRKAQVLTEPLTIASLVERGRFTLAQARLLLGE